MPFVAVGVALISLAPTASCLLATSSAKGYGRAYLGPLTRGLPLSPASVVDWAEFRYGGHTSAVAMCQGTGQLGISSGKGAVVSNSVFSSSGMVDLSIGAGSASLVTLAGNVFRSATCGVTTWSNTRADIVNNSFESSLNYAYQSLYSTGIRFWYNQVASRVRVMGTPQPTRQMVDVRYNTWFGQAPEIWYPSSQSLVDWGGNFYSGLTWPRDPNPLDSSPEPKWVGVPQAGSTGRCTLWTRLVRLAGQPSIKGAKLSRTRLASLL